MPDQDLSYHHVDVFAERRFSGNGLTVFPSMGDLTTDQMQTIAVEMRQFETIFLQPEPERRRAAARVFTMEEELPFAGHPALGAASVLHDRFCQSDNEGKWTLALPAGENTLTVTREDNGNRVIMDQGKPVFGPQLTAGDIAQIVDSLSLAAEDVDPGCPPQVVSTGLPYLIVPIRQNIDRSQIRNPDLEDGLARLGADFVYVLDTQRREGRTWDNAGLVEDIATGSAAGPAAAFLVANRLATPGEWFEIQQGRFVARPSVIGVRATDADRETVRIEIKGSVIPIAQGTLNAI